MALRLRGGYETNDARLDRVPFYDERSLAFPVRPLIAAKPRRAYTWRIGTQLDQGREGACTGFSVAMEAAARPVVVSGITDDTARQVYHRARQLDAWPGEDYDGSSVLAAIKAGVERGWYREYRWALGPGAEAAENDLALAVGYRGPAVMGTYWWTGMFRADADGYLNLTGEREGGHAYLVNSYSLKRDAYFTPNSWGGGGQGWIRRVDMVRLLEDQGEACIPTKRLRP